MQTMDFKQTGTAVTDQHTPSPDIWADCPIKLILEEPQVGKFWYEDWKDFPLIGTQTTQIAHGKYKVFATTGSSVVPVSAVNSVEISGGALKLSTDTDNDSAVIGQSYPSWLLTGLPSTSGKLWFECCIAQKSVVTNMASTFVGLAETDLMTFATALPFNAGDPITNDGSMIGFHLKEDGLGVIDTVVSDRATSYTDIGAAEGGTLVAYTFKKLGFVYDPARNSDCIRFYTNNTLCTTKISKTTLIAYTNLDANALGFLYGTVADSAGTAHEQYMKWWRCAQLNPGQQP